jgi:tRNA threonylcarbamoyladenosine biosynthesis protein TsaB
MYYILCIETATEICSVALITPKEEVVLVENSQGNMHASQLTILIEEATRKAGITLQQLDAIAVSKGPGSYTGLRVGVSTVKGLCYALDKPLLAIPTLQSLALMGIAAWNEKDHLSQNSAIQPSPLFVPMLDARRMEVYCAGFDLEGNEKTSTEAKIIDNRSFAEELEEGPVYFMGNGVSKCKAVLTHPNAFFIDDIHCSARGMENLAYKAFKEKQFEDAAYFEPFYLKDFVATTPKKKG